MELNLDFSNAAPPEKLPEGPYDFKIEDITRGPAKSGEGDYLKIRTTVSGGEFDGKNSNLQLSLAADFIWIVKQWVDAVLNVDTEFGDFNLPDTDDLLGREYGATIEHSADGKYFNQRYFTGEQHGV